VVCGGDGSADALRGADGPVLLEGPGALDGGLVGACAHVDVVCSSVTSDGALLLGAGGGVVGAEGFDDVILDERVGGPAVDGEITVAVGIVGAGVVDDPGTQIGVNGLVHMTTLKRRSLSRVYFTWDLRGSIPFHQQGYRCQTR